MAEKIRKFETGADRDLDDNKIDFRGMYSPLVLKAYGEYMHAKRIRKDGTIRSNDNWKKGFPYKSFMESGWRHFMDWYTEHEGYKTEEGVKTALMGLMFNAMGYLHQILEEELKKETNGKK